MTPMNDASEIEEKTVEPCFLCEGSGVQVVLQASYFEDADVRPCPACAETT